MKTDFAKSMYVCQPCLKIIMAAKRMTKEEDTSYSTSEEYKVMPAINKLPDEVIGLILGQLSVDNLKTVRWTCNLWNKEACHVLKDRVITSVQCISRSTSLPEELVVDVNLPTIEEYVTALNQFQSLDTPTPLNRIRMHLYPQADIHPVATILSDNPHLYSKIEEIHVHVYNPDDICLAFVSFFQDIVSKCGAIITCLDLADTTSSYSYALLSTLPNNVFPALRRLGVPIRTFLENRFPAEVRVAQSFEGIRQIFSEVSRILRHSKKVRVIKTTERWWPHQWRDERDFLELHLNGIEHLEIEKLGYPHFLIPRILQQPSPPDLKSFVYTEYRLVRNDYVTLCPECTNILNRFASSLKYVSISAFPSAPSTASILPVLPFLKILRLEHTNFRAANLWILTKTPMLEELTINLLVFDDKPMQSDNSGVYPHLKKISCKIHCNDFRCSKIIMGGIRTLRNMLPNLRHWVTYNSGLEKLISSRANKNLDESQRLFLEELTIPLRKDFPSVCFKGLKKLNLCNIDWTSKAMDMVESMHNNKYLPDLEEIRLEGRKSILLERKKCFPELE